MVRRLPTRDRVRHRGSDRQWYPIVIACMSLVVGLFFLPETKDVDITKY
jgi:hypothetical protein